jgi:hypothetical protein
LLGGADHGLQSAAACFSVWPNHVSLVSVQAAALAVGIRHCMFLLVSVPSNPRACPCAQLSCPKALLLAGTDRLDRALTIGQMQGKFQLILMPTAGHAIHEDEPERAAEHLLGFLRRFRVGEPPLQFPRAPAGVRPVLPVVAGPTIGEQK